MEKMVRDTHVSTNTRHAVVGSLRRVSNVFTTTIYFVSDIP